MLHHRTDLQTMPYSPLYVVGLMLCSDADKRYSPGLLAKPRHVRVREAWRLRYQLATRVIPEINFEFGQLWRSKSRRLVGFPGLVPPLACDHNDFQNNDRCSPATNYINPSVNFHYISTSHQTFGLASTASSNVHGRRFFRADYGVIFGYPSRALV